MLKLDFKRKALLAIIVVLIIGAFWQTGKINLPAKLTYALRFAAYKLSQPGKITAAATIKMDIKPHRQEYSLSCEIAALKMALEGVGINVAEKELVEKVSFDQTSKQGNVWGDPQKGFVGKIDGKMPATGYGVYDEPIAQLANQYTKAEVMAEKTPQSLAAHLLAGRPVVLWGFYGRGQKLSWTTPEGKQIKAVNGEHARTVIGFTGDANGPQGFYLIDPLFGPLYWKTDQLLKNWEALDRMAVVIYPEESALRLSNEK